MEGKPLGFRGYKYTEAFRNKLYKQAFEEVRADTGTPYPCTQKELDCITGDRYWRSFPAWATSGLFYKPPVSIEHATQRLEDFHRECLPRGSDVGKALERLRSVLEKKEEACGADLMFKIFNDLDCVFFRGKLKGHATLAWKTDDDYNAVEEDMEEGELPPYGWCGMEIEPEVFFFRRALIELNADQLLRIPSKYRITALNTVQTIIEPFGMTLSTLLHEMVHAYLFTLCCRLNAPKEVKAMSELLATPDNRDYDPWHGSHFVRCAKVVDEAANRLLNGVRVSGPAGPDPRVKGMDAAGLDLHRSISTFMRRHDPVYADYVKRLKELLAANKDLKVLQKVLKSL
ncbi:MAG: hypothetical protein Q9222_002995 [Ikaeria aurantiellina]